MGIKTVPQPPYSPDLAPCDIWLFPKFRGCRYETIVEMKGHWHAYTRGLPWGFPEVVGTVQQMHCNRRWLLRRGLEFHVCTINKSAHTKKVWKLIVCTSYTNVLSECVFAFICIYYSILIIYWCNYKQGSIMKATIPLESTKRIKQLPVQITTEW